MPKHVLISNTYIRWFDCITFPFKSVSQLTSSLVPGDRCQISSPDKHDVLRRVAVAHGAVSREASIFFLENNE